MCQVEKLRAQKEALLSELGPFRTLPHSNPYLMRREELLLEVERKLNAAEQATRLAA